MKNGMVDLYIKKVGSRYAVYAYKDGKRTWLGYHDSIDEAREIRDYFLKTGKKLRFVCDVCGNRCERIVLKVYKSSMTHSRGREGRVDSSLYTHSAKVGSCCIITVNQLLNWHPRKKRA